MDKLIPLLAVMFWAAVVNLAIAGFAFAAYRYGGAHMRTLGIATGSLLFVVNLSFGSWRFGLAAWEAMVRGGGNLPPGSPVLAIIVGMGNALLSLIGLISLLVVGVSVWRGSTGSGT
jgi:hypothetical protein